MSGEPLVERIVAAARQLAAERRHGFVGTEHLLAAMVADREGFAATVLSRAGLDLDQVASGSLEGLRQADAPPEGAEAAPPSLSRFAERAVEAAVQQSRKDGRETVEEKDLLRQLVAQPKGRMAQVLRGDGKALVAIRAALGDVAPVPAGTEDSAPAKSRRKEPKEEAPRAESRPKPEPRPKREPAQKQAKDRGPAGVAAEAREPSERRDRPERRDRAERRDRPEGRGNGSQGAEEELPPLRIARPLPDRTFPWSRLLLLAVPLSVAFSMLKFSPVVVFVTACIAVLPLAGLMGEATESLAERTGPTIGGLLNATFGNAAELIIALVALKSGLVELVKASITGSILGNLLLILGLSFLAGGAKGGMVRFNRTNAGMSAAMLALAVIGLVFPAIFHATHDQPSQLAELHLSEAVAVILVVTYILSLVFSLKTHKALFGGGDHPAIEPKWAVGPAVGILALATIGVVVESEILVHSVQAVTETIGLSQTFLGLVIIPLIGNAAEHATAIVVARKGQMDLAFQIAIGSSTQVALLVAPILVFAGLILAAPMNLVFPLFDVAALAVSTIVIAIITLDGETNWFEGVQLLAVYGMIAVAAFFI